MTIDDSIYSELSYLTLLYKEDRISNVQFERLEHLLQTDEHALSCFIKIINNDLLLREPDILRLFGDPQPMSLHDLHKLAEYEKTALAIELPRGDKLKLIEKVVYPPREKRKISTFSIVTFVLSAAAVLMLAVFLSVSPPRTQSAVGSLNAVVDAAWSNACGTLKEGSIIYSAEPLVLTRGLVGIKTDSGVDLVIEGPAEFEFSRGGDILLTRGKIAATVPAESIGFTIMTANARIIDLGTEFGIQVGGDGNTEVHVYKGKVTLLAGTAAMKKLTSVLRGGQARNVSQDGAVSNRRLDENLFVRRDELMANVRASQGSHYDRWLAYSYKLRRDPSLVAYYTFEKNEQQATLLENKAFRTEGRLNGTLVSTIDGALPAWTLGRWPQKTALNFNRSQQQVVVVRQDPAIQISGPITVAAWIRCDEPEEGGHIVSCRLPDRGTGNFQFGFKSPGSDWQNKIQFGRMNDQQTNSDYLEDRVYSAQTFGTSPAWRFIAATHDNQTVRLYLDGQCIETQELPFQRVPVAADLLIGTDELKGDPLRFTGDMGELLIFNRVLPPDRIHELYEAGQP